MNFKLDTPFMEAFEELNKLAEATDISLTEASNYRASKQFWDAAKNGSIDDISFRVAFKDELVQLGLWNLFSEYDGTLISKRSYGDIKKAAEANPDSWAVKAMLKVWVLQFKEGVKSESRIRNEQEEILRKEREEIRRKEQKAAEAEYEAKQAEERERERKEREATFAIAKERWNILNEKLPLIQEVVKQTVEEYTAAKKELIKPDLEKAVKLKADIEKLTRTVINYEYKDYEKNNLAFLNKGEDLIEVEVSLDELDDWLDARDPKNKKIFVKVRSFFRETPYYTFKNEKIEDYIKFTVEDLTAENFNEDVIKSKVTSLLDGIWPAVSHRRNTLSEVQKEYDEIVSKVNEAKAAQAAANADRPVDPSFINKILDIFTNGVKKAEREKQIYTGLQDGSPGLAYALAKSKVLVEAAVYLVQCNWRSYVDDEEIAVWRTTDSLSELEDALDDTFKKAAARSNLNIEIIK